VNFTNCEFISLKRNCRVKACFLEWSQNLACVTKITHSTEAEVAGTENRSSEQKQDTALSA